MYDRENTKNLTNYEFIVLKTHLIISDFSNLEAPESCSICHEKYEDELSKKTNMTKCYHDLYIDCLKQWIVRILSCQICRKEINFEYDQILEEIQ